MCSLDLIPIPRVYVPEGRGVLLLADLDQWHTCRNMDAIRDWMTWRNRDRNDNLSECDGRLTALTLEYIEGLWSTNRSDIISVSFIH